MNKYKKLLSNSLIFTLGNLGSKLLVFILVPLYTYALTPKEYGFADLGSVANFENQTRPL